MKKYKILIGSDHGGFNLKKTLINYVKDLGHEIEDVGTFNNDSCDYPDYAIKVAQGILEEKSDKGILVCGTGIGMAIAANRFKGIRAANCSDTYSARMSVIHNNANILTLGERVLGTSLACDIVKIWLENEYEGGRHQKRINKFDNINC